jgi:hypothetical protein
MSDEVNRSVRRANTIEAIQGESSVKKQQRGKQTIERVGSPVAAGIAVTRVS